MDSALSSKVLRIANSPLYAQRRKSENLRQALVVFGLNATLTLALSFSLVKSLRGAQTQRSELQTLLAPCPPGARRRRARSAMPCARRLAEEIFLAALLQDVGMLALDQAVPDLVSRRRSTAARPRGARRAREETAASRSCRRRRVAHADLELAAPALQSHRAQPSFGAEFERSTRADLRPLRRALRSGGGSVPAGSRAASIRRDGAMRRTQFGPGSRWPSARSSEPSDR